MHANGAVYGGLCNQFAWDVVVTGDRVNLYAQGGVYCVRQQVVIYVAGRGFFFLNFPVMGFLCSFPMLFEPISYCVKAKYGFLEVPSWRQCTWVLRVVFFWCFLWCFISFFYSISFILQLNMLDMVCIMYVRNHDQSCKASLPSLHSPPPSLSLLTHTHTHAHRRLNRNKHYISHI